mgnify:CR=1 FL=1
MQRLIRTIGEHSSTHDSSRSFTRLHQCAKRLAESCAPEPRNAGRLDSLAITGTLPPRGVSPQYRIRNADECHERVTTQESIEPVAMSPSGSGPTLLETTFGHGGKMETQETRNQDAKEKTTSPGSERISGHQVKLAEIPQRGKGKNRRS